MTYRPRPALPVAALLAALALNFAPPAVAADIFTWVDANGVTHYSSNRPLGQAATTFPLDPAYRAPERAAPPRLGPAPVAAPAAETPEQQALRLRLQTVEGQLDAERNARVTDLKDQLAAERDRVRRLEAERTQGNDVGDMWNTTTAGPGQWWAPAPVLVLPARNRPPRPAKPPKPPKPAKPPKPDEPNIAKPSDGNSRLPYPSISGPSSNLR